MKAETKRSSSLRSQTEGLPIRNNFFSIPPQNRELANKHFVRTGRQRAKKTPP
jgi:hypothetical protein